MRAGRSRWAKIWRRMSSSKRPTLKREGSRARMRIFLYAVRFSGGVVACFDFVPGEAAGVMMNGEEDGFSSVGELEAGVCGAGGAREPRREVERAIAEKSVGRYGSGSKGSTLCPMSVGAE